VPKFTVFWLATYFGGIIAAFFAPLIGLLDYLFEYYLRPRHHWWGDTELPDWRWNMMIAVVCVVTFLIRRNGLPKVPSLKNPSMRWFVALALSMIVVTTTWSVDFDKSWEETTAFLKLLILYGLIVGNVRTQNMFDAFMATHIAGAGWWGWQAYIDPKRISGRLINIGSSDTLNDNLAAAHLLTVLPILCVYALTAKDKRLRLLALITAPFIVNTFILCNSRGATVGLAVGMAAAMLLARRGHRVRMFGAAVAVAVLFVALADKTFIERQKTINDEDAGAERIATWQGARQLLTDHPLGVGGGGFEYLSPIYIREIVNAHDGERRSVHNTWLLIATEWGIQGFVFFVGLIGSSLLILNRVRKMAKDSQDIYYRSLALQVGLISTLTAATFSNRFLGESIYWLLGLSFALYRIAVKELAVETVPATAVPVPVPFQPAAAATATATTAAAH